MKSQKLEIRSSTLIFIGSMNSYSPRTFFGDLRGYKFIVSFSPLVFSDFYLKPRPSLFGFLTMSLLLSLVILPSSPIHRICSFIPFLFRVTVVPVITKIVLNEVKIGEDVSIIYRMSSGVINKRLSYLVIQSPLTRVWTFES